MGLATSSLTIGKTSGHSTFENGFHQRTSSAAVHHLIVAILIKGKIEAELLVLQILRQIDLQGKREVKQIFFCHNNCFNCLPSV